MKAVKYKVHLGDVVMVEWVDAIAGIPAWTPIEDLDWDSLESDRLIRSVGTIVRCEQGILALAQNFHASAENVSHIMIVPMSLIIRIKKIK